MKNELVVIKSNKRIGTKFWHCVVRTKHISTQAIAGQFINVLISNGSDPLLRRPFSIHKVLGKDIEILFEVVGKATEILSRKKPGDVLDIIGPLGSGFEILPARDKSLNLLVAGGMGVAPLVFLAEKLKEIKNQKSKIKNIVLIGGKTGKHILCEDEFKKLGCTVKIATDDGSRGFKGRVTDLLEEFLRGEKIEKQVINQVYACGPKPMLRQLSLLSDKYGILAQISLEEHMGCGIGACLGCVVETIDGYKRVCKDGPVFMSDEIVWRDQV